MGAQERGGQGITVSLAGSRFGTFPEMGIRIMFILLDVLTLGVWFMHFSLCWEK